MEVIASFVSLLILVSIVTNLPTSNRGLWN